MPGPLWSTAGMSGKSRTFAGSHNGGAGGGAGAGLTGQYGGAELKLVNSSYPTLSLEQNPNV